MSVEVVLKLLEKRWRERRDFLPLPIPQALKGVVEGEEEEILDYLHILIKSIILFRETIVIVTGNKLEEKEPQEWRVVYEDRSTATLAYSTYPLGKEARLHIHTHPPGALPLPSKEDLRTYGKLGGVEEAWVLTIDWGDVLLSRINPRKFDDAVVDSLVRFLEEEMLCAMVELRNRLESLTPEEASLLDSALLYLRSLDYPLNGVLPLTNRELYWELEEMLSGVPGVSLYIVPIRDYGFLVEAKEEARRFLELDIKHYTDYLRKRGNRLEKAGEVIEELRNILRTSKLGR